MSPERIKGDKYGYSSDILSFGLTLLECAIGEFPYPMTDVVLELMQSVVGGDPPRVPENQGFSKEFSSFISVCLQKEPEKRASAEELLQHPWLQLESSKSRNKESMIEWSQPAVLKMRARHAGSGNSNMSMYGSGDGKSAANTSTNSSNVGVKEVTGLLQATHFQAPPGTHKTLERL